MHGASVIKCENLMSVAFQADFGMPTSTNKTMILSTVPCFRLVLAGCRHDTMLEFDESFTFQAHFGTPEHIEKTMILLTATCFLIFYHNIEQLTELNCKVCNQ